MSHTSLRSLSAQSSCELHILWLDSDTSSVDRTQVGVLEERDEVSLNGLLESTDGRGLESKVTLEVLCNFSDESLERQLSDEKLSRLLVSSNLSESDCTWLVSVRLLDTSGLRWSRLSSGLVGERDVLSWGLATDGLSCCLLGSSHCCSGCVG